jgi:hypothetical protein
MSTIVICAMALSLGTSLAYVIASKAFRPGAKRSLKQRPNSAPIQSGPSGPFFRLEREPRLVEQKAAPIV